MPRCRPTPATTWLKTRLALQSRRAIGASSATLPKRSFGSGASTLGWGFALFALAEISYMTYHLNWTTFLFAHTISEVLDAGAFVLVFVAAAARLRAPSAQAVRA